MTPEERKNRIEMLDRLIEEAMKSLNMWVTYAEKEDIFIDKLKKFKAELESAS